MTDEDRKDFFAGCALIAKIMSEAINETACADYRFHAEDSYNFADAMMTERDDRFGGKHPLPEAPPRKTRGH